MLKRKTEKIQETQKEGIAMSTSSELPKYPKPMVCSFDLKQSDSSLLDAAGFETYNGSLGPLNSMENQYGSGKFCLLNSDTPKNLHEYDILIFALNNQEKIKYNANDHIRNEVSSPEDYYFFCSPPQTIFNPAPYAGDCFVKPIISKLTNRDSVIIIFASVLKKTKYQIAKRKGTYAESIQDFEFDNYSFMPNGIRHKENKSGKFIRTNSKLPLFESFLNKYTQLMEYNVTFYNTDSKDFFPLLFNNDGEVISYIEVDEKQLIIVFPELEDKGQFLKELLETVLPDIIPQLFPYHLKGSWKERDEYLLPNQHELKKEKEDLIQRQKDELAVIDKRIVHNENEYDFLHKILLETDHELVKNLITFLQWLGFVQVVDVDAADNKEDKEEDISIEIDKGLLIIEAKGIGGTSKDDECAQISKIRSRRCEMRGAFDVFALYIVNHQRHLPPLDRKNPPFSKNQIKDATLEKRGLLTTWDLFNLFFNIEIGVISKEQARQDLLKTGLIKFELDKIKELGVVSEIFQHGEILVIKDLRYSISAGEVLFVKTHGRFIKIEVKELRVNDEIKETVTQGEVGIKINHRLKKGDILYFPL